MVAAQQRSGRQARYIAAAALALLAAGGYVLARRAPAERFGGAAVGTDAAATTSSNGQDDGAAPATSPPSLPAAPVPPAAPPSSGAADAISMPAGDQAQPAPAADEPTRHEAALSQVEAVAQFPASFDDAVAAGDTVRATSIMRNKLLDAAATGGDALALAEPYMAAHDFLWADPTLVNAHWSGCLQRGCDRKVFRERLARFNPGFAAERGACLDAWAALMPMLSLADRSQAPVATVKPQLEQCLARGGFDQSEVVTPLQYYLGLVRETQGPAALQREHSELSGRYPGLPPLSSLLAP